MKSNNHNAIELTHITKEYVIHHEKPTLVEKFYKSASGRNEEKFLALNDISLTIKKGERVGIIGPNGSGKTTLLKIIAGITTPSKGTVQTFGKVVSLIDLEAGFHPDLTGYQNIFLNGMLLGMKKRDIEAKLHTIIEFADIHQFIDTPLFTYSQGMKLRLGFAVSISADFDILALDEAIAVGDMSFRNKVYKVLRNIYKSNKTILMASHWPEMINDNCDRVITFSNGTIFSNKQIRPG